MSVLISDYRNWTAAYFIFWACFLLGLAPLRGERLPEFDMDTCVGESRAIVEGSLDATGELQVTQVLKGDMGNSARIKLVGGKYQFENLQRLIGGPGPLEAVVFLDTKVGDEWRETLEVASLVGFDKDAVFLMESDRMSVRMTKSNSWTKESFLRGISEALAAAKELDGLIAAPRSAERTGKLVAFALLHCKSSGDVNRSPYFPGLGKDYYLHKIAGGLSKPTEEEQRVILQALQDVKTTHDRVVLLNLCGTVPLNDSALDSVAGYLPRTNPPEVREAVMNNLSAINLYRAVDYLVPYLTLDEPQLSIVLRNLGPVSFPASDRTLNIKAVDALETLALAVRERHKQEGRLVLDNESYAVIGQLSHYMHPRLFPILYDWALSQDHVSSNQAFSDLQAVTGLKYAQDEKAAWKSWWHKAEPVLKIDYDLQTATGRNVWMTQYSKSDRATQGLLMRLWFFEPKIDEGALVESAMHDEVAKTVLAELWQRGRLSGETRKEIVQRFLSVKLMDRPPKESQKDKTLYAVAVVVISTFPFPEAAWMENRRTLTIGARLPAFQDNDWSDWSLHGPGIGMLSFQDSDHADSPPQARALMELREKDYPLSSDTLWTLTWNLGPVQLSNRAR